MKNKLLFDFFEEKQKKVFFLLQNKKTVVYLHRNNAQGLVVQLVRIHACHAWGRGFESRPDREIGNIFRSALRSAFLPKKRF